MSLRDMVALMIAEVWLPIAARRISHGIVAGQDYERDPNSYEFVHVRSHAMPQPTASPIGGIRTYQSARNRAIGWSAGWRVPSRSRAADTGIGRRSQSGSAAAATVEVTVGVTVVGYASELEPSSVSRRQPREISTGLNTPKT